MRNITFILMLFVLIGSCKKDRDENLKPVIFSGFVLDSSNRVGMVNVPIKAYWSGPGLEITAIDSTRSDAQGNYSLKTTIDILKFRNRTLSIVAMVPLGFVSIHDLEHPMVGATLLGYSEESSVLPFVMYQKANLTINLNRTLNDTFSDFELNYNYGGRNYWVNIENNKPTSSITYEVETALGVQTKVHWTKKFSSGTITIFQDSIMILPNTNNTLTVDF